MPSIGCKRVCDVLALVGLPGILVALCPLLVLNCASNKQSTLQAEAKETALTPGMTKMFVKPGVTSQADILEMFGPPDLVTHKRGKDVWTYDKVSHEIRSAGSYLTVILAGASSRSTSVQAKSIMLILYFDENEIVLDYRMSYSKF